MSSLAPADLSTGDLARLHCALETAAAYTFLADLTREQWGTVPMSAYLHEDGSRYVRDDSCPAAGAAPARVDCESPGLTDGMILVPYRYRGRPMGALLFEASAELDIESLRAFVEEHFAPAYFRAAWLEDVHAENTRINEQIYFLREMGSLLGEIDLEPLLVNVLDLTCGILGSDVGSVTLRADDGQLETKVDFGLPHEILMSMADPSGEIAVESALESGKPLLLTGEELVLPPDSGYAPRSLLILPLMASGRTLGSINLVAGTDQHRIDESGLSTVRPAVGLAATAVENALLFSIKLDREREQQQLAVAQQIQSGLLPSEPPHTPGLQLAASSVPATMIGGDYFDYLLLPDGTLGLVVADVAGKGVPAGLIMTATRAIFRTAAQQHSRPGAILEQVNRLLCAEDFGGRFVTAVCARVDIARGSLVLAAAGHEPVMMLRAASGQVERLGISALPLGIRASTDYSELEVELGGGDAFALYTDGVNEAMNEKREQFGSERLMDTIRDGRHDDAVELHARILRVVESHIGEAPRHDDTTLMVACYRPNQSQGS